ncbi:MAG: hypothetical protein J6A95_03965 [Clostridia bacterium]|nr:hypothetical protein [Clostridia bacterium]
MRKTLVAIELWGISQGNTGTVTGTVEGHCGDSEQETEKEKEKSSKREKVKEKEINKKERMGEVCVYKEDTHEKPLSLGRYKIFLLIRSGLRSLNKNIGITTRLLTSYPSISRLRG